MYQESMFSETQRKDGRYQVCTNCNKIDANMPVFSLGLGRIGMCRDCVAKALAWFDQNEPSKFHGKLKTCLYCHTKKFKNLIVYDEGGEAKQGICLDCAQKAIQAFEDYEQKKAEEAKPKQLSFDW